MKIKLILLTIFLCSILASTAFAQESTLDKMSLNIRFRTHRGQPEWRWTPIVDFDMRGNMSDSVALSIEYTLPNGKPFVKLDCADNGRSDDYVSNVSDCGNDLEADSSTNLTGVFGFQIKMSDELNGVNKVLYSGKFTVDKYLFNPAKQPQFAKNFYYFVNYDWRLTTAFVGDQKDEYTPKQLLVKLWIKADQTSPEANAYLIYKGKTVAEVSQGGDMSYSTEENDSVEFTRLSFRFNALTEKPNSDYNWWKLYENPGEYEIKVLRKGELARTLKFTIGADGKLVESGVGKEIKEGSIGIIVPVQLVGNSDGTINPTILKSGWWGNPISGITQ